MFPEILRSTIARYRAYKIGRWISLGIWMSVFLALLLVFLITEAAIITWMITWVWLFVVDVSESAKMWFDSRRSMTSLETNMYRYTWMVGLGVISLGIVTDVRLLTWVGIIL